ncbi:HepT-like ribonuclease domain-containing protein [Bifidobacterium eulemuris]|uniref:Antitoxin n=1 Tax=Bifidobacterium eulemuris TaxID=1765219 RepID=A0A261GEH5_9BIFI|nr:HepT-like ribonuclease domain-containing protein [Bifidobacterium eulemuris]OZG69336.1 antitoxin [Bifidobacterium eulemuris]QOL31168.1 DUF86 domain-containing protein [Bifidobacterium eulemuris]
MSGTIHADRRYRDETNLLRLVEHLEHAFADASQVDSADALESDRRLFNSVAMEMLQAQESARRLSDEFLSSAPALPWKELRGLRNIIVHQYDEIESHALYESATANVKSLLEQLRPYVATIEDE